jgi:glycyl-tRNA synthetase alpha chain
MPSSARAVHADLPADHPEAAVLLGRQGCALLQPYDMEVGAGTSHTATFLRALGPEPWKAAYVQPSRRPKDGRYGDNPNRLQHYYQYQVVLKPAPSDILELYLGSLRSAGLRPEEQRRALRRGRLGEPDARRLGPGLGGLAQRHGSDAVHLLPAGRRHRLPAHHRRDHLRPGAPGDVPAGRGQRLRPQWTDKLSYRDVYQQNEVEQSTYNFEHSDVEFLLGAFAAHERQAST